jgi:hypothetical protein
VYDTCINEFRGRHKFIGFIDSDEFIVIKDPFTDLPTLLKVPPELLGCGRTLNAQSPKPGSQAGKGPGTHVGLWQWNRRASPS